MFVKGRLPYRCIVRIRFRAALARRTVALRPDTNVIVVAG